MSYINAFDPSSSQYNEEAALQEAMRQSLEKPDQQKSSSSKDEKIQKEEKPAGQSSSSSSQSSKDEKIQVLAQTAIQASSSSSSNAASQRDIKVAQSQPNPAKEKKDSWLCLDEKTNEQLAKLSYLSPKIVNHRFSDIPCPEKTAISTNGRFLHANKVGINERAFIASQAPLPEDYELFWQTILENESVIFDLTTVEDQQKGGVTKYYP